MEPKERTLTELWLDLDAESKWEGIANSTSGSSIRQLTVTARPSRSAQPRPFFLLPHPLLLDLLLLLAG